MPRPSGTPNNHSRPRPVSAYPAFADGPTPPACRGADWRLFFPEDRGGRAAQSTAKAREICYRCPLLDRCRSWALDQSVDHLFGIWGGLTQEQRRSIRRRESKARQRAAQQAQEAA